MLKEIKKKCSNNNNKLSMSKNTFSLWIGLRKLTFALIFFKKGDKNKNFALIDP